MQSESCLDQLSLPLLQQMRRVVRPPLHLRQQLRGQGKLLHLHTPPPIHHSAHLEQHGHRSMACPRQIGRLQMDRSCLRRPEPHRLPRNHRAGSIPLLHKFLPPQDHPRGTQGRCLCQSGERADQHQLCQSQRSEGAGRRLILPFDITDC